jgi:hypothetical protein
MKAKFLLGVAMSAGSIMAYAAEKPMSKTTIEATQEVDQEISAFQTMFGLDDADGGAAHNRQCANITLTPEQKGSLTDVVFEFRKAMIIAKGEVKIARLTYGHTVSNPASVRADAEAAGVQVRDSVANLVGIKKDFATKVLYDILTPDQRGPAYECMKAAHRSRGRPHGGRR